MAAAKENITTPAGRARLTFTTKKGAWRREPFWRRLSAGRYIGYRKMPSGSETWIARFREDGKQHYRSLGDLATLDYDQAVAAANRWFKDRDAGVSDEIPTVADACREYVTDLEAEGRLSTAEDAQGRFRRTIYDHALGAVRLDKLRTAKLKAWRNDLPGSKSAQDRTVRSLKAALNFAVLNRRVNASAAVEWKSLPMHNADGRRTGYLDLEQRRSLIEAATGGIRDLIEGAALTGARPGEIVAMKARDFDVRTATVTLKGKTGSRSVPVSPAAAALFKRLSKGKLPEAPMFMHDGRAWRGSKEWSTEFRTAADAAHLPKSTVLYTLRHSWITEALRSGMSTLDVARLTGTSLQMIQEHYGQFVADRARERLAAVTML